MYGGTTKASTTGNATINVNKFQQTDPARQCHKCSEEAKRAGVVKKLMRKLTLSIRMVWWVG